MTSKHDLWYNFAYKPAHIEAFEMKAGESMDVTIDTLFGTKSLMPSDFSFVVWSTEEPVNIDVTSAGHGASQKFPQYQISDTVKIYDLKGNLIENPGHKIPIQGGGGSTTGGGSSGGDSGGDEEE